MADLLNRKRRPGHGTRWSFMVAAATLSLSTAILPVRAQTAEEAPARTESAPPADTAAPPPAATEVAPPAPDAGPPPPAPPAAVETTPPPAPVPPPAAASAPETLAPAASQAAAQAADGPAYTLSDLEYMLAPIALYPDPLLAVMLPATLFPEQIVEAYNWIEANPRFVQARNFAQVDRKTWDSSVEALVRFSDVVRLLHDNMEWAESIGLAFSTQPQDVSTTIQMLRAKAQGAGTLKSTPQQVVSTREQNGQSTIYIAPANPERIYVPVYDSATVFTDVATGAVLFGTGVLVGSAWNNRWGWKNRGWNTVWVVPPGWRRPPHWGPAPGPRPPAWGPGPWRPDRPIVDRPGVPDRPAAGPGRPLPPRPDRPGLRPDRPGVGPGRPDRPGLRPDRPGAGHDRPGLPPRPDVRPDRPGPGGGRAGLPERPVVRPERPGAGTGRPAVPERAAVRPERPSRPSVTPDRPSRPSAAPNRPNTPAAEPYRPSRPSAQPNRPSRPSAAPSRPARPPAAQRPQARPQRARPQPRGAGPAGGL
ncbi:DUF3300 domain-containing protein [Rhodoplanes serenus]|uniref:DUF3300 domain-containing protein n=1 Tax=Rhodoplanes serenus TaxID=200615 RepID=A0A9X4XNG6_9BRAD|nr:DUF3300 domain-containing protein [Rhodoplanes serenus]MTW18403.1 DUF3300 domain-containing protein [Rhodoplanes serenus]